MRLFALRWLAVAVALVACSPSPPARPPEPGTPSLSIDHLDGEADPETYRLLTATHERIRPCLPGSGGVVEVRVVRRAGRSALEVDPDGALDPAARECVQRILSTIDVPDQASGPGGPIRPSGFSALLRISW